MVQLVRLIGVKPTTNGQWLVSHPNHLHANKPNQPRVYMTQTHPALFFIVLLSLYNILLHIDLEKKLEWDQLLSLQSNALTFTWPRVNIDQLLCHTLSISFFSHFVYLLVLSAADIQQHYRAARQLGSVPSSRPTGKPRIGVFRSAGFLKPRHAVMLGKQLWRQGFSRGCCLTSGQSHIDLRFIWSMLSTQV